ncbi:MAG TPA: trypsin-like peptidase domain-containing protein [Polyangium sp.]|nr:trypsin-like peptidase domain-containing protein [Polyangium sp.]
MNAASKTSIGIGLALFLATPLHLRAENELTALAERTNPAVLLLTVEDPTGNKLGTGTGFVVSKDGRVVTNHHVIESASAIVATSSDGSKHKILGTVADDAENDIAILQMEDQGLPALTLGDSSKVKAGDEVVVIGSPMGLSGTLTVGIVSAIRPKGVPTDDDDKPDAKVRSWGIQISAAISPGSSGSPIMKRDGEVVAVAVGTLVGQAQNLNFGVPIEVAKGMLDKLGPNAPVKSFAVTAKSDLSKNLLISAGVIGGMIAVFFLWGWIDNRRGKKRSRAR